MCLAPASTIAAARYPVTTLLAVRLRYSGLFEVEEFPSATMRGECSALLLQWHFTLRDENVKAKTTWWALRPRAMRTRICTPCSGDEIPYRIAAATRNPNVKLILLPIAQLVCMIGS
jgi:hypothetical protein